MKKLIYQGISAFCIGLVVTSFVINIATKSPNTEEKIQVVLVDTLPLENGGEVNIEVIDGVKHVHITFVDFQFVAKKRSVTKKVVKSLNSLFARLEGWQILVLCVIID